jgi:hypothetical protein
MHTLAKREPTAEDFEVGTNPVMIEAFQQIWPRLKHDITLLKENLPEGFLQRRLVTMNYDNVRNIVKQRTSHRYKRWDDFIEQLVKQLKHPEYLKDTTSHG